MRLFKWKKVVDEREEMEMMKIEHYMYWFTFWALLFSIFGQLIFMKASFTQVAGEWTVFMLMAIGLLIGELKGGHFDYTSRPGWKCYLFYAMVAAVAGTLLVCVNSFMRGYFDKSDMGQILTASLITGVNIFILTYICLAAAGAFVKHRRKKLESEYDEEEE